MYMGVFFCSAVPRIFGNQQSHYIDIIKQMLSQSLQDHANQQVWFEAVRATTSFLVANDKETAVLNHFKDLLSPMIQVRVGRLGTTTV